MSPVDAVPEAWELARLADLEALAILDTSQESQFDEIVAMTARALRVPVAAISLVDRSRQWPKALVGLDDLESPRAHAFCARAIEPAAQGMLVVPDATVDERFRDNVLVTGPPHIRFYVGHVLFGERGHPVGTLCAIDTRPREHDPVDVALMTSLAQQAQALILRRAVQVRTSSDTHHTATGEALTRSFGLQIERLQDALARATEELQHQRRAADAIHRALVADGSTVRALAGQDMSRHRHTLTVALENLESARRDARVAAFHSLRHDGMSVSDIAAEWGVSRQLVSRALRSEHPTT